VRAWNSTFEARSPMRRKSPRRVLREKVFVPYVTWLHAPGGVCVVCGETRNLQGSHVDDRGGGMGQKRGRACDMVRMCGDLGRRIGCHTQWGQRKGRFEDWTFDQREQASIAWRVLHWEAFLDHAGVFVAAHDGDPEADGHVAAMLECETEIRAALGRLAPERGQVHA